MFWEIRQPMILQFITHWMALYLYTQNITRCIKGSFSFSGHNKKHLSQTVWQSHNFINYLMELDVCFIFLTGDIMPYDYQQLLMTLIKVSLTAFPVFMKLSHWNDMRGNLILCDKLVFESWSLKMSLGKLSLQCISWTVHWCYLGKQSSHKKCNSCRVSVCKQSKRLYSPPHMHTW